MEKMRKSFAFFSSLDSHFIKCIFYCVVSPQGEGNDTDDPDDLMELEEPDFPMDVLNRMDDMINKPRWVVPVLPKGELEVLLEESIRLCKRGEFVVLMHGQNMWNLGISFTGKFCSFGRKYFQF